MNSADNQTVTPVEISLSYLDNISTHNTSDIVTKWYSYMPGHTYINRSNLLTVHDLYKEPSQQGKHIVGSFYKIRKYSPSAIRSIRSIIFNNIKTMMKKNVIVNKPDPTTNLDEFFNNAEMYGVEIVERYIIADADIKKIIISSPTSDSTEVLSMEDDLEHKPKIDVSVPPRTIFNLSKTILLVNTTNDLSVITDIIKEKEIEVSHNNSPNIIQQSSLDSPHLIFDKEDTPFGILVKIPKYNIRNMDFNNNEDLIIYIDSDKYRISILDEDLYFRELFDFVTYRTSYFKAIEVIKLEK